MGHSDGAIPIIIKIDYGKIDYGKNHTDSEDCNYSSRPNFKRGFAEPPLNLGHGWVVTPHRDI